MSKFLALFIYFILFFYCQPLFKTVHLNLRSRNKAPGFLITGEERDGGADVYLNWLGFLVVMIMNWALGAIYARGREVGGGEGRARRCAKQADGWPDTVLIMATLVCWEATLCSRSMAAEEWRIVMTRSPCPGTRSSFKDVAISNVCSVIRVPLSPSSDFQKFIGVAEAVIMAY